MAEENKTLDIDVIAACLKAMGDSKRLLLLDLIRQGKQCNCNLCGVLELQPNLISHHLRILKDAGLVQIEKDPTDSRWIYYTINRPLFERIREYLMVFLDPDRIQPRQPTCGPQNELTAITEVINSNPK